MHKWSNSRLCSSLSLTARGSTLKSESDVCIRHIPTSKVNPRTESVKIYLMAVDP